MYIKIGGKVAKANYELPNDKIEEVRRLSGASSKKAAIVLALDEYLKRKKLEALIRSEGTLSLSWTKKALKKYRG